MVSAYTLLALSLAALTAPAYAQSSGSSAADAAQSLSTSCQATIAGLFVGGGDFAQCANARGLLSVVQSSETTELTSNIDEWLDGACSQNCAPETIDTAATDYESGCAEDLAASNSVALALDTVIRNFTIIQDFLCLQSSSNSTYCINNLIGGVSNATETSLGVTDVLSILAGSTSLLSFAQSVPAAAICTDCVHAMLSKAMPLYEQYQSEQGVQDALQSLENECGAQFTDGLVPDTVTETNVVNAQGNGTATTSDTTTDSDGAAAGGSSATPLGVLVASLLLAGLSALA